MGDYIFRVGNQILFRASEIAIYYTEDTHLFGTPGKPNYTVHKHGIREQIERTSQEARRAYTEAGLTEMAASVAVISSDRWDLEPLNAIISTTGYLGLFLEQQITPRATSSNSLPSASSPALSPQPPTGSE